VSLDPITAGLDLATEIVRLAEQFKSGQITDEQLVSAARKALGADPLAGMAAEDAARHARLVAAARTLRTAFLPEPANGFVVEVEDAIKTLADHHDPQDNGA